MSTPPEVIAARKLNQAKYALEDFDDGVKDLNKAAMVFGALILMMGFSLPFGANNLEHLACTAVGAVALPLAARFDYLPQGNLFALTIAYAGLLVMEALTYGWPDMVLPFVNLADDQGFPVVVNHLTPFIYWAAKVACGVYVLRIFWLRSKVYAQPEELLRKAAGDRVV